MYYYHMITHVNETDSTMTYAEEHFQNCSTLQCVYSDRQTGGYGRHNRTWFSPEGNIYMTLSFPLVSKIDPAYTLNMVIPVTIIRVLKTMNIEATLKWPNDIIVNNCKVCGILSKIIFNTVHIGIGLNVNCMDFAHIERIIFPCASLKQITGKDYDIASIVTKLYHEFEHDVKIWNNSGIHSFLQEYEQYLIKSLLTIRVGNTTVTGSIVSVFKEGVSLDDGTKLYSGDVVTIHDM